MKKLIYPMLLALGMSMGAGIAHAAKPQIGGCYKEAQTKGLKDRALKDFMNTCASAQRKAHDDKLKACRAKDNSVKAVRECMDN